jgi:hypothetical protein
MTLVEVKTAELTRRALDYAVAKAVGQRLETHNGRVYVPGSCPDSWTTQQYISSLSMWKPSTDWSQGGPLIDRERIKSHYAGPLLGWECWCGDTGYGTGPTSLIAAMRCLVASKLGGIVMVPKELLP